MNKKLALLTVFLVVLIDLMGFGIVLPYLAFYAAEFEASPSTVGLLYSVYSVAQLVFSPIWGSLSDRFGRRPIMILSTLGACFAYILFAFSGSLKLLFLSRLFAGIMAGNIAAAQAYVADVTEHEDRAKGMGLIGAAFGIGFVVGPALGTGLMQASIPVPFFQGNPYALLGLFAAGLSFASFCLVIFKLPEPVRQPLRTDAERVVRSGIFLPSFWRAIGGEERGGRHILPMAFAAVFLLAFGQSSLYGAFPLFCKNRLGLSPEQVGMQYVWMGLTAVFIQGGMIKPLEKIFGEERLFLAGSVLMALGLFLIPFAASAGALTAILVLMSAGGSLNGPTLMSLVSKQSAPEKYGVTMGTSQGFSALGRAVGPAWGGFLFGIGVKLPFVLTALLVSVTLWIGTRFFPHER